LRHGSAMSHSDDSSRQSPLPVYIDGLVILKIIKHVQDEGSEFVNGDLVGLDVTRRLIKSFPDLYPDTKPVPSEPLRVEVTNCVPELPYAEEELLLDFRQTMVSNFREAIGGPSQFGCGIDHKTVGWYTTSSAYASDHFIERQYKYQCDNSNSVMLIYEAAVAAASGCVSLRVVRLTDMFMELYKNGARAFTKEELDKRPRFSDAEIFEEVPFFIHNCAPIQALLQSWSLDQTLDLQYDTGRLDLNSDMFLERYLESASDAIFDLGKLSSAYERNRAMVQRNRLAAMQEVENKKRAQGLPQVFCISFLALHPALLPSFSRPLPHNATQHISDEDILALRQQYPDPNRLELLLTACQVEQYELHALAFVSAACDCRSCALADTSCSGTALELLVMQRSRFTSSSPLPLYPMLTLPMNKARKGTFLQTFPCMVFGLHLSSRRPGACAGSGELASSTARRRFVYCEKHQGESTSAGDTREAQEGSQDGDGASPALCAAAELGMARDASAVSNLPDGSSKRTLKTQE
jgi:hypothetical protein